MVLDFISNKEGLEPIAGWKVQMGLMVLRGKGRRRREGLFVVGFGRTHSTMENH